MIRAALLAVALAAEAAAAGTGSLAPVDVKAMHTVLELKGKERHARLAGSVVARQADLTLRAPEVDATLAEGSGGIRRIVAVSGVEVTQGSRVAQAGRAEFDNAARTIVFTGAPRLWDGENLVQGTRIVLHVDDRTVECFECSVDVDPSKAAELKSLADPTPAPAIGPGAKEGG